MSSGNAALRQMLGKLQELERFPERVAPKVAKVVERELRVQLRRGDGPDGKQWRQTKDGRRPLRNAGDAVRVRVEGDVVVVQIDGHHARHHLGAVRGAVRRPIIPTRRIPNVVTRSIKKVLDAEFSDLMEVG